MGESRLLLFDNAIRSQQRHAFHSARVPALRHLLRATHSEALRAFSHRLFRFPLLADDGFVHERRLRN